MFTVLVVAIFIMFAVVGGALFCYVVRQAKKDQRSRMLLLATILVITGSFFSVLILSNLEYAIFAAAMASMLEFILYVIISYVFSREYSFAAGKFQRNK